MTFWEPLPAAAPAPQRRRRYEEVEQHLRAILEGEPDPVAAMATVACELHHAFDYFHWTGFYRRRGEQLVVGPYQGGHGCLRIDLSRGICGAAARTGRTQLVKDVSKRPEHIACSSSTRSELVVPVRAPDGAVVAVLDIDSDEPAAFGPEDAEAIERLCDWLGERYGEPW